jgi:acyl-CoA reductase-like NAD-dependent aldehyde dehydrogenase
MMITRPVASQEHYGKVRSYVETVAGEGGTIITGRPGDGWMVRRAVVTGFGQGARHSREEIFGPLVVVIPFDTEAEAIELANDPPCGLNTMLFTESQRPDSGLDDLPNMILNRRHLLYAAHDHGQGALGSRFSLTRK